MTCVSMVEHSGQLSLSISRKFINCMRLPEFAQVRLISSLMVSMLPASVLADTFDPNMLWGGMKFGDLSRFELDNPPPVGEWLVDVFLNGRSIGKQSINFEAAVTGKKVAPCFSNKQVELFELKQELLPAQLLAAISSGSSCIKVQDYFPESQVIFDYAKQSLDLSVPQIYVRSLPLDYIAPQSFDYGVPAGRLNYTLSSYQSKINEYSSSYYYAGLDATLNYGGWRLRHLGNYSSGATAGGKYNALRTYMQRDVFESAGQLTIGESYSDGSLFDSYTYNGLSLNFEPRSLPASQLYYSPVIEGVADSNAQVVVSQGGVVIHSQTVPPGPFSLTDITGFRLGQDLDIVIIEADGSKHGFSLPVNSSATLLRPGQFRYSSNLGRVSTQGYNTEYAPFVGQFAGTYGLSNTLTGYAGALLSEDYNAFGLGASLSTFLGAFTGEVTLARNDLLDDQGASFKLAYSTQIKPTGTYLNLATYRYSTHGYWSFNDALANENYRQGYRPDYSYVSHVKPEGVNQRMRFDLSLNQSLPQGWGGVYLSASKVLYWETSVDNMTYQFGYRNSWRGMSYGFNFGRSFYSNPGNSNESMERDTYTFSVTMPLGSEGRRSIRSSAQFLDDSHSLRSGVSGVTGDQQQITYGADVSRSTFDDQDPYNSLSLNGGYSTPVGQANASFSMGTGGYQQYSLGFNGGLLAHEDGLILGQSMGETMGLLHAENAEGASLVSSPGAKVNADGYALIPYLSPYRRNRVELDPKGMPYYQTLDVSSTEVIPAVGAVVKVDMKASRTDELYLIELKYVDGTPLPFGRDVQDKKTGVIVGNIGQSGRALISGISEKGTLFVNLDKEGGRCFFNYAQDLERPESERTLFGMRQLDVGRCEVLMFGQD